jgi:hypothetical protein
MSIDFMITEPPLYFSGNSIKPEDIIDNNSAVNMTYWY